jgi:hypothetical protein
MMTQQRQAQRRQILAMMGVTPWVGRETVTASLQEIMAAAPELSIASPVSLATTAAPASDIGNANANVGSSASHNTTPTSSVTEATISPSPVIGNGYEGSAYTDSGYEDADYPPMPDEIKPKGNPIDPQFGYFEDKSAGTANNPVVSSGDFADEEETQIPIEPFTLQGIRYNNWVLLVDSAALSTMAQKLWQNMQVGLSSRCDSLAFPFCKTMSTLDMANASLAGFVFKLGGSEHIQVAALTDLPEGLDHEQMVRTPLLEEMLSEPAQKRQLWQLLCA